MTTERKALALGGNTSGNGATIPISIRGTDEAISLFVQGSRKGGPREPRKACLYFDCRVFARLLISVSPRRQQAVTYQLPDPKAEVFITGMKCVVF